MNLKLSFKYDEPYKGDRKPIVEFELSSTPFTFDIAWRPMVAWFAQRFEALNARILVWRWTGHWGPKPLPRDWPMVSQFSERELDQLDYINEDRHAA